MQKNLKSNKAYFKQKSSGLSSRLWFVFWMLIVFRLGSFIPIPGVNASVLANLFEQQKGTIIEMFNMFSGGALRRASIFSLGIMPYISASIIMQLLTFIHPALIELKKDGNAGNRKINQYTRYLTLFLSIFNAIGVTVGLPKMIPGLVAQENFVFYFSATVSLVTGTVFLMWIGEQITERGIGNGVSLIICTGIIANLPKTVLQTIEHTRQGEMHILLLLLVMVIMFLVVCFIIFVEKGYRRIDLINYSGGRQSSTVNRSLLPLKVNMAGVIPAIFASSLILFPTTLVRYFSSASKSSWLIQLLSVLQPGQPLYVILYTAAIIFFCFFYTALIYDPRKMANNLKISGDLIAGIRPGEQTAHYIDKIMTRLTLVGALYISLICLIPEFFIVAWKVPFYFGGTSLLIVVVVIMEFRDQIKSHKMNYDYRSITRKTKIKK